MADYSAVAAAAAANAAQQKAKRPGGQFQQNLQGAQGGTIQGAHGGTQQLGAAAQRRLGPNTAGGGLNPTPPTMDPAQKPPPWQALQQAGIGGQGSAAANRAALAGALPGFQPAGGGQLQSLSGAMAGENAANQPMSNIHPGLPPDMSLSVLPNGMHPPNGAPGVASMDGIQGGQVGPPGMFNHPGQQLGTGDGPQELQGGPGGSNPLPGFQAAPGTIPLVGGQQSPPIMSLPGPSGKFPLRPGLPTKPFPTDTPPTGAGGGVLRPNGGGGGMGPRPRNNMAGY